MATKDVELREWQASSSDSAESLLSFEERVRIATSRTPEQIAADRAHVLARSPEPRPLPPGKTLEDVIVGQWQDDTSEEEILAALRELS